MSRIKLLLNLINDVRAVANDLQSMADAMASDESSATSPAKVPAVTHEKIRELAVKLSRNGKREEIKRLIEQYGVKNVTAIADDDLESFYSELAAMEVQ